MILCKDVQHLQLPRPQWPAGTWGGNGVNWGALQKDITDTPFAQICLLILAGVAIHVVYLAINFGASKVLDLPLRDFKAVLIMASQKTLPIAIAIISFLPAETFGAQGLLTIPCIIGHLSQLFIDAFLTARMAAAEEERQEKKKAAESEQVCHIRGSALFVFMLPHAPSLMQLQGKGQRAQEMCTGGR